MRDGKRPGAIVRRGLAGAERERLIERIAGGLGGAEAVLFAYAFGSFVEGRPFGDIDVAVFIDMQHGAPVDALAVGLDIAGQLEAVAGLPVDAMILNDAPLGIRMAALRGRLLLSRDEPRRLAFVESTCLQAMDMAYLARESLRDLLRAGG